MELIRIGLHLSHDDNVKWETHAKNGLLHEAYIEDTGMEYLFLDDFPGYGILAAWHESVGQVTYYSITRAQWQDIVKDI